MKLLLIHLSDIHITSEDDVIADRFPQIVNAVKNLDFTLDMCIVISTGDIAYSGTDDQYIAAWGVFEKFENLLSCSLSSGISDSAHVPVHFVFVPGNHDCDLTTSSGIRQFAIASILKDAAKVMDSDIVQACTHVQTAFFDFIDTIEPSPRQPSSQAHDVRLGYEYHFSAKGELIRVSCYNTAWLSEVDEIQGRLFFPSDAVNSDSSDSVLAIAVFHHPYNWLESNNARSFRNRIESVSDLVLTGHEHASSRRMQKDHQARTNIYVEGGVLQDSTNPSISEFNAFVYDTSARQAKYGNYKWKSGAYVLTEVSSLGDEGGGLGWVPYTPNTHKLLGFHQLSSAMREYLSDPGAGLQQRDRGSLSLEDVFVYPDLVEVATHVDRFNQRVSGEQLQQMLESTPRMMITGDMESGKTSLAKKLFLDLMDQDVVPVWVPVSQRPPRGDKVYGYIESMFCNQYDASLLEEYRRSDKSKRAVIIDDYHKLAMTSKERHQFLSDVSKAAKYLIVFSHDLTADLEELANPGGLSGQSSEFIHYRIQPLGYMGRNGLVERWMLLGGSMNPTSSAFATQRERTTRMLNTLIGKNYVPSYPVYILSVLQALDSATPIDISASTHGYFYELFIRSTLARGRTKTDFDVIVSYLSFLAYQIYSKELRGISEAEFRDIHRLYENEYDIERSFDTMKGQLLEQAVLIVTDEKFGFRYNYLYNYFVASYLKNHLYEGSVQAILKDIARSVYLEGNANILLFLAHLTRDPIVINELLSASRDLYSGYAPAALEEDIEFLKPLWSGFPEVAYEEGDPNENREAVLAEMDRNSSPSTGQSDSLSGEDEAVVDADDPVVRLVTALRHLEILGQVVKNFPGSLEASTKLTIARECFQLGLRSLSAVFELLEAEQSEIVDQMSYEIQAQNPEMTVLQARQRASENVAGIAHSLCYGMIVHVTKAVGARDLFNTYTKLLSETRTPAFELINAGLKMDNSGDFPDKLVKDVAERFDKALLPLSVLRHLVASHFHLFPVNFKIKQSVSGAIGLKYSRLQGGNLRRRMLPSRGGGAGEEAQA